MKTITALAVSSSTTQPTRFLRTRPTRGPRVTSPGASDERTPAGTPTTVIGFFLALAAIGWLVVAFLTREVLRLRRQLADVRRATEADDHESLPEAIADERREAEDRVAHAEAVQHWLLLALDEDRKSV